MAPKSHPHLHRPGSTAFASEHHKVGARLARIVSPYVWPQKKKRKHTLGRQVTFSLLRLFHMDARHRYLLLGAASAIVF